MNNEDKKWKRKFIAFLKENGIYEKWIYNMKRQHPTIWNLFFHGIYENKCSNGISRAFYWVDTKDGHDYWSFYNIEWKRIVGNGDIQKMF